MPVFPQEQSHVDGTSGFFAPQLLQKFPTMPLLPQVQSQTSGFSGFLAPQLLQKFPTLPLFPQVQSHVSTAAGFLLPQLLQNIPVAVFPQEHCHESAAGVGIAAGAVKLPCIPLNRFPICGAT